MSDRDNLPYLKRQLRADPFTSAGRIISSRNAMLELHAREHPSAGDDKNKTDNGREADNQLSMANLPVHSPQALSDMQSKLDNIRATFWTVPLPVLLERLQSIDGRLYPELAAALERLKRAAVIRNEFPNLSLRLKHNSALFNCIKQSLTLPPCDAAGMKEALLRSLQQADNLASFKQAAQLVRREFPQIYALDPEWYDQLSTLRKGRKGLRDDSSAARSSATTWLLVVMLIALSRGCGMLVQ